MTAIRADRYNVNIVTVQRVSCVILFFLVGKHVSGKPRLHRGLGMNKYSVLYIIH